MTDFNRQSFKNVFLKENAKKKEEEVVFVEKPASTVYSSLTATPIWEVQKYQADGSKYGLPFTISCGLPI